MKTLGASPNNVRGLQTLTCRKSHVKSQLRLVARAADAKSSSSENMSDLSPAARAIFNEAQKNILALNTSRIRALQELKAANEKIAQLEHKLDEATRMIRSSTPTTSTPGPPTDPHPPAHSPSSPTATATATITINYATGWEEVFAHFQVDDQPWTSLPGLQMNRGTGDQAGWKTLQVPGNAMKFVLTNGKGQFDTPNPYGEPNKPRNYEIHEPGSYLLQSGQLSKLS